MLRSPVNVIVQIALRKAARYECCIVCIQNGGEDHLLETIVVVAAQRFDFRPYAGRITGATVQRCSVQICGFWRFECGAQKRFETQTERYEINDDGIADVDNVVALFLKDCFTADTQKYYDGNEEDDTKDKRREIK